MAPVPLEQSATAAAIKDLRNIVVDPFLIGAEAEIILKSMQAPLTQIKPSARPCGLMRVPVSYTGTLQTNASTPRRRSVAGASVGRKLLVGGGRSQKKHAPKISSAAAVQF